MTLASHNRLVVALRIEDQLYFAPGLTYRELDLRKPSSVTAACHARLVGWYMEPAYSLIRCGPNAGFAATLLCAAGVEAAARYTGCTKNGGSRIAAWLEAWVEWGGTAAGARRTIADDFHDNYRNTLAHNALVSGLGQISLEQEVSIGYLGRVMIVNPLRLIEDVRNGLDHQFRAIGDSPSLSSQLRDRIRTAFHQELAHLEES